MELVIVPVTLLVGMALIYWGVNGSPNPNPQMVFASTLGQRSPIKPRRAYTPAPAVDEPELPGLDLSPSSLRQADVLLADLMTEMIEMRSEIAKIKTRLATIAPEKAVEAIVTEEAPAPEPVAPRTSRRRARSAA